MNERSARIRETVGTPGWSDIHAYVIEQVSGHRAYLDRLMQQEPDKLTGKTAIARSNRMRALLDLQNEILDAIKPEQE